MDNKLLTIQLEDIDSVPVVMYNGQEIVGKVTVSFDWKTNDADCEGYCGMKLEYLSFNGSEPISVDLRHSRKDYVKLEQKLVNNVNSPDFVKRLDINDL